jgi:guanylate kinase
MTGTLFIVSAPSGTGKTSLVNQLIKTVPQLIVSVSYTTRPMRAGEVDGVNYHFVDKAQFQHMVGEGRFLEYAEIYGHYYGTDELWVKERLQQGINVILEIDWQGAAQIRRLLTESVSIFILPPSLNVLSERLTTRNLDDKSVITKRLAKAQQEMSHCVEYDYIVVNDRFDEAISDLKAIIHSQKLTVSRQSVTLTELIAGLLNAKQYSG